MLILHTVIIYNCYLCPRIRTLIFHSEMSADTENAGDFVKEHRELLRRY